MREGKYEDEICACKFVWMYEMMEHEFWLVEALLGWMEGWKGWMDGGLDGREKGRKVCW